MVEDIECMVDGPNDQAAFAPRYYTRLQAELQREAELKASTPAARSGAASSGSGEGGEGGAAKAGGAASANPMCDRGDPEEPTYSGDEALVYSWKEIEGSPRNRQAVDQLAIGGMSQRALSIGTYSVNSLNRALPGTPVPHVFDVSKLPRDGPGDEGSGDDGSHAARDCFVAAAAIYPLSVRVFLPREGKCSRGAKDMRHVESTYHAVALWGQDGEASGGASGGAASGREKVRLSLGHAARIKDCMETDVDWQDLGSALIKMGRKPDRARAGIPFSAVDVGASQAGMHEQFGLDPAVDENPALLNEAAVAI